MHAVPPVTSAKPRILLIDDDADAGELMVQLLELRGYSCDFCVQADTGLRRWHEQKHEVVVSDLNLRQTSGFQVAESLVGEPEKPVLIALSGQLDLASRERSRAAGFDHHMAKPIELDTFESIVATWARSRGGSNV